MNLGIIDYDDDLEEEESSGFAAGMLNIFCTLPTLVGTRTPDELRKTAILHIQTGLRADCTWLAEIVSIGADNFSSKITLNSNPRCSDLDVTGETISFPLRLMPTRKWTGLLPYDADTWGQDLDISGTGKSHDVIHSLQSFLIFEVSKGREILLVGWETSLPPLQGMFHYIPAAAQLIIDAYIRPSVNKLIVEKSGDSATTKVISNAKGFIGQWAKKHTQPKSPLLFAHGRMWTPIEIAAEVENDTPFGAELYNDLISQGIERLFEKE